MKNLTAPIPGIIGLKNVPILKIRKEPSNENLHVALTKKYNNSKVFIYRCFSVSDWANVVR